MITLAENVKKLDDFSQLKLGWNYYDEDHQGQPINENAIKIVKEVLEQIEKYNIQQPFVAPWAGGEGICAEWDEEGRRELGFSTDGVKTEVVIFYKDNYDDCIEFTVNNTKSLINFIRYYFNQM